MPYIGQAGNFIGQPGSHLGNLTVTGNIKSGGQLTANDTLFKMIMDTAADLGDNFLIEDGGTDGSGTNAGDDICLEKDLQVVSSPEIVGGAGKILQVFQATDSTERSTTSTSFVTASNTLSVSITPSSTSSKILCFGTVAGYSTSGAAITYLTIKRDSTLLGNGTYGLGFRADIASQAITPMTVPFNFLDSPSSTSALTYQVYFRGNSASYTHYINARVSGELVTGSITVMEIGA